MNEHEHHSRKNPATRRLESIFGRAFTEAEILRDLNEKLAAAFQKLRESAVGLGPQRIYASARSIVFAKRFCYLYVRPKKSHLEVRFFLPHKVPTLNALRSPSKKVKYANGFRLERAEQVDEALINWIRQAYEYAP